MKSKDLKNESRFDSIEILSKVKSQVENRVKLVHSLIDDDEIEEKDLLNIQLLYTDARADVNAGIDRLLIEMEATGSQGKVEPYIKIAEKASTEATKLISACDGHILGEDRSIVIDSGIKLADTIVNALLDLWKMRRKRQSKHNSAFMGRIESLKWIEFDKLVAE